MDVIKLKPEKEQKTLWIITWVVSFVLGMILWVILSVLVNLLIFGITILAWLIIMIPIIFWIPAAFRALEYYIDDEGVKMKGGVVWKKHVTVPYLKITNIDITQGPLQRYYNIGTIHVQTAGSAGKQGEKAELKLRGVRDLNGIRDMIIKNIFLKISITYLCYAKKLSKQDGVVITKKSTNYSSNSSETTEKSPIISLKVSELAEKIKYNRTMIRSLNVLVDVNIHNFFPAFLINTVIINAPADIPVPCPAPITPP